jgi:putative spermidine/putrescine transport system ATP-binding protein
MTKYYGDSVTFTNVEKKYNETIAVSNFNLKIKESEFITLLGPSGSGKTTVLNMIAGFITQNSGSIQIGETSIHDLPTEKRNVGMVFQNYSLFPHMNIFNNVAFPLKMRKLDKNKINDDVKYALDLVGLKDYDLRMPNELSGGQRQRIAFARAIVFKPKVLLMDEPLGALDLKLREKMQIEIKNYHEEIKCTIIYVTHDQGEALTLSDRIVIMNQGKIVQIDNPKNIYDNPISKFAANFIGETNILNIDHNKFISIRPEKLKIINNNYIESKEKIILKLIINQIIFLGDIIKYICSDENKNEIILKKTRTDIENDFNNGDKIQVYFNINDGTPLKD